MRRLVSIVLLLLLCAGVLALVIDSSAQGSDSYSFDVIFDDARGLISGQTVKIAGADAGTITNVVVTPDDKARVEATISGPFRFHSDATCIIRPEGLIAENYLECDPGTNSKPLLRAAGGYPPTVPVTHTSEPVNLLDLFNIFNLPTRERFQALIDELGIATAGDGTQINAILQRANPTLAAAQRVITILDNQTSQIATAIDATDRVAAVGASHTADVQAFIKDAASLTQLTSDHSGSLASAIHQLPAFLSASTPALKQLQTVATDGTPLLANLRAATPALNRVDNDIVPFTRLARPALASLSAAVSTAIPDTRRVTPLVKTIANYLKASSGTTASFSKLIVNLIQHGFSENFLSVLYYVATSLAKYDTDSHLLSSLMVFPGSGLCGSYATTPSAACNAHYGASAAYTPARASRRHAGKRAHPATTTTGTSTTPRPPTTTNPASGLTSGLQHLGSTVASGVSSVAGGVATTVNKVTSGLTHGTTTSGANSSQTSTNSLQNLLNYLLK